MVARQNNKEAAQALAEAQATLQQAQMAYTSCSREVAMLEERLSFLQGEREKLALWSDEEPATRADFKFDSKPDPLTAATPAAFIEALRRYRFWAGHPSLRSMQRQSGNAVASSTMHAAMSGDTLPPLRIVTAIIIGCGGSENDLQQFGTAWRRLAMSEARKSPSGG